MAYLVADYWAEPPANIKPHWRIVAYSESLIHAKGFALRDSIVVHVLDNGEAWRAYKAKRLPDHYTIVS